jgi:hypothetical protein
VNRAKSLAFVRSAKAPIGIDHGRMLLHTQSRNAIKATELSDLSRTTSFNRADWSRYTKQQAVQFALGKRQLFR